MMRALTAENEEVLSEAARQKRLGQYFTSQPLAKMLAALAGAESAKSIIDPMAGRGDMLASCLAIGANPQRLGGIEIDERTFATLKRSLPKAFCVLGSAFSTKTIGSLTLKQWGLVITNPPYVRYQSMAASDRHELPTANEIRDDLRATLKILTALDDEDRRLFEILVESYSGLADLAVPSWILSAALCSIGGRIALVVPESWLSRDYSAVVQYLLLRWFKIEFVVEDVGANWFADAQVKTNLLIARRVERRDSSFTWLADDTFLKIRVTGELGVAQEGVCQGGCGKAGEPEIEFARWARRRLESGSGGKSHGITANHITITSIAENLQRLSPKHRWLRALEPNSNVGSSRCFFMPEALADWRAKNKGHRPLTTLAELGIRIGQGLRTGANEFFYATKVGTEKNSVILESSRLLGRKSARAPQSAALPVLRRQSELPEGYVVKPDQLPGRVLALQEFALPEDIAKHRGGAAKQLIPIPEELADWIRFAETINVGDEWDEKRIYELSAVAPNIRREDHSKSTPPRFWYMLPAFAPRHIPDLIIPRINGGLPRVYMNDHRGAVVDANFSTIWVTGDAPDIWGLLALLNSSWCLAALECTASVMGGGALKVEATHLTRLPIPLISDSDWLALAKLGKLLALQNNLSVQYDVDALVASAALGRRASRAEVQGLRALAEDALKARQKPHRKKSLV